MATTMDRPRSSSPTPKSFLTRTLFPEKEGVPQVPWVPLSVGALVGALFFGAYRWYQQAYSFTAGLDAFEPEFQTYWMNLLWGQLVVIALIGIIGIPYIWLTRPKDPYAMSAKKELGIYNLILGGAATSSILAVAILGIFVEADAAWHQVTIRDTDFTPTHIGLFYFAIPLGAVGLMIGFVWIHTRMPDFVNRVSVPLAVAASGLILIMPNVGFNEWGHTFFYAEELFAAPIHWGFVVLGWALFAIGGFMLQCLSRIRVLTAIEQPESVEEKEERAA